MFWAEDVLLGRELKKGGGIMKRLAILLLAMLMLAGCSKESTDMDLILSLRQSLQTNSCSFDVDVVADYLEEVQCFSLHCSADPQGNMEFSVTEPESIRGISGNLTSERGELTYEDKILAFSMLADGMLSPVAAPWMVIRSLQSGYIVGYGDKNQSLCVTIDDVFEQEEFRLEVSLNEKNVPIYAEIYWKGHRILSMIIDNFKIL